MATRSCIGQVQEDGTVRSVYCHWDGYPAHNGRILLQSFVTPQKVRTMIDLGHMSLLGHLVHPDPEQEGEHTFDKPQDNVCIFYGRDRGEEDVNAISTATWDEAHTEEFAYIMDQDSQWWVKGWGFENDEWFKLTPELLVAHNG